MSLDEEMHMVMVSCLSVAMKVALVICAARPTSKRKCIRSRRGLIGPAEQSGSIFDVGAAWRHDCPGACNVLHRCRCALLAPRRLHRGERRLDCGAVLLRQMPLPVSETGKQDAVAVVHGVGASVAGSNHVHDVRAVEVPVLPIITSSESERCCMQ